MSVTILDCNIGHTLQCVLVDFSKSDISDNTMHAKKANAGSPPTDAVSGSVGALNRTGIAEWRLLSVTVSPTAISTKQTLRCC